MAFQYIPYLILPFASAAVLLVLAIFAFRRRRTPGAAAFGVLMLAACEWKLVHGLGFFAGGLQTRLFLHNLEYAGVAGVSVAWLAFVLHYTGFWRGLSWRGLLLLSVVPGLTLVLVWTNGAHGLVWENRELETSGPFTTFSMDHGPWFWVFAAYCYLLVLIGTLLLIAQLLRASRAYRWQTAAVLVGVVVLWAGNVAYLLNLSPVPYLNPTLLSFPLTGVLFTWSLFRLRLLDVAPVARDILIEKISDGVIVLDDRNRVVDLNRAAERILDLRSPKVLWRPAAEVLPDVLPELGIPPASSESSERVQAQEARIRRPESGTANVEVEIHAGGKLRHYERTLTALESRSGQPGIPSEDQPGGYLILLRDITERRRLEERLEHQALHDPLTNLPNRTLFTNRLSYALGRANQQIGDRRIEDRRVGQDGYAVVVLFLDLDDFKAVNDSLGHEVGDALLIMAAQRIKECLRPGDTLARLGGDEFVVLVEEARFEEATMIAGRIAGEFDEPFRVEGHELFISSSIGISISESVPGSSGSNPADLLKEADIAMYQAKEKGKNRWEIYEGWMGFRANDHLGPGNDLRRAVEREEFVLYYQPVVHLTTGEVEGFEALLRWEHPGRGLLLPGDFVRAAEEGDLIFPLGRWVLRQATLQAARWHEAYPDVPPPSVSVNISPRQLGHPEFVEEVEEILRCAGLGARFLRLEITENVVMEDAASTIRALEKLRDRGIKVLLDDFGTGYSSLGYLTRFTVDALKIDRSIIGGLDQDPRKASVVQTIVTLSHSLGQRVVAEGIETRGQLDRLRELGCELGQGNFFWEPRPPEESIKLYLQTLERTPPWGSPGQ